MEHVGDGAIFPPQTGRRVASRAPRQILCVKESRRITRISDFNSLVSLYHPLHAVIVSRGSLSRSAFVRSHCGLDIAKQVFQVHGVNEHGVVKARKTPAVHDGVGVLHATARHTWSGSRRVALPTHWARDLAKVGLQGS